MLDGDQNFGKITNIRILFNNKTNFFVVIFILLTAVLASPFLIPHLSHPSISYHILIHIISLDIAAFITIISFISYRKTGRKNLLLACTSFMLLLIIELIYLLQASGTIKIFYLPLIEAEFSHILLLGMLALFAIGILQTNKLK
ncbi:MAG TPA: hypothetical protein VFV86_05925 [Nitrososphaeraceae archaeon]|nr:hypothetical protein [Nitrososphaeraceae archaeon]